MLLLNVAIQIYSVLHVPDNVMWSCM